MDKLAKYREYIQTLLTDYASDDKSDHEVEVQLILDTEMIPISRTIGNDQLVDEMVFKFTHTIKMDWMLPGIDPTGKGVEVPLVAIVRFSDGKLAHEHIYWDQASVLVQIGLLDASTLAVVGIESAQKALDSSLPANALMHRAG